MSPQSQQNLRLILVYYTRYYYTYILLRPRVLYYAEGCKQYNILYTIKYIRYIIFHLHECIHITRAVQIIV